MESTRKEKYKEISSFFLSSSDTFKWNGRHKNRVDYI